MAVGNPIIPEGVKKIDTTGYSGDTAPVGGMEDLEAELGMLADATFDVTQTHIKKTPQGKKCPEMVKLKVGGMGLNVFDGQMPVENHLYFAMKGWTYSKGSETFDVQLKTGVKLRFGTKQGMEIAENMQKHTQSLSEAKAKAKADEEENVGEGEPPVPDLDDDEYDTAITEDSEGDVLLGYWRVQNPILVRSGVEVSSDEAGKLEMGDVIKVAEVSKNSSGTVRLRSAMGWVSFKPHLVQKLSPEYKPDSADLDKLSEGPDEAFAAQGNETSSTDKQALASLIIEKSPSGESGRDFEAAFSGSWTVEMDQALIQFASERALVKRVNSVGSLEPEDLFDNDQPSDHDTEEGATSTAAADHAALSRNISVAPQFSPKMRAAASTSMDSSSNRRPAHLNDNSRGAIRARFMLLREWNAIIRPALPLIDLRMHADEVGQACLLLCQSKGRLLPETKHGLIRTLLKQLSSRRRPTSIPQVKLEIAAPGQEGSVDNVFEQLFKQLHRRHPLAHTEERAGEGQLWEVSLRGGGTAAFTDTTDVGGHFRTSIRTMCEDLITTPPSQVSSSETALPLFVHTTNFVRGAGDGEDAAELYLPNPRCTSDDYLERYRFVGVMCGASARFTAFMNIDLSSLCWKYILGETIATQDLRAVDVITAELIESVVAIDDETTWTLRQQDDYDEPIRWCVQLPRKAAALALRGDGTALVSFADREEYCALVKEVWLSQFSSQLNAVAQGFYSVFPQIGARLLTWRELERRVCGLPDVDVSQLKRIARYEGSYSRVSHRLMPVLHHSACTECTHVKN